MVLASELAANAAVHADAGFDVWVDVLADRVQVGVDDPDLTLPVIAADRDRLATSGRGPLVAAMADRWGADPTANGKQVWFEIDT